MATIVLDVKSREDAGTGAARANRREGFVPCIVYGENKEPEKICIAYEALNKYIFKSSFFSSIFKFENFGKKDQLFVAKDVQFHPVNDRPMHIDFMRVGKGSKVVLRIPLSFVNELASPGIKKGGVLNVLVHEIDVVCDPFNVPEKIDIDLTGFEFHHTVHAQDIKLGKDMSLTVSSKNFTIATVVAPTILKQDSVVAEPVAV